MGLLNAYHLRVVLYILITEMQSDRSPTLSHACPMYTRISVTVREGEFQWPSHIEALIVYSFYIGNIFGQVPGGWLAEKIGGKSVIGICLLLSAIVNLLYPLSIMYWDFYGAVSLRILNGFFQGPIYPTITTFIQCWLPHKEKSILVSIIYSGSTLGDITGGLLTAIMVETFNSWALPFYVWGALALLWYILFMVWVHSRPTTHRFISEKELEYLHRKVAARKQFTVPWIDLIKSTPVWATVFGQSAFDLVFITLFADSPKYMKEILKLNVRENAVVYSVPYLILWFMNIVSGCLASYLEHHRYVSLGVIRKSFTIFAVIVPSAFLIATPYMGCNRILAITCHVLAVVTMAPFYAGVTMNVEDLSLHYGGIIMAFGHTFGSSAGIIGPYLIGAFTENQSLDEWKKVYWIVGGIATVFVMVYVFLADTKRQLWDYSDDMFSQESFTMSNYPPGPSEPVPKAPSVVSKPSPPLPPSVVPPTAKKRKTEV